MGEGSAAIKWGGGLPQWGLGAVHRLNMEVFGIWAPCHIMCTAVLIG
jgi:hypothetical protein